MSEPNRIQVWSRSGGKDATLAEMILERADSKGIEVEFLHTLMNLPTSEKIAQAIYQDDIDHGRTDYAFESIPDDEKEWYHSNANAVLQLLKEVKGV